MKKQDENLRKYVDALRGEQAPAGPGQDVVEATVAKLAEIGSGQTAPGKIIRIEERIKAMKSFVLARLLQDKAF